MGGNPPPSSKIDEIALIYQEMMMYNPDSSYRGATGRSDYELSWVPSSFVRLYSIVHNESSNEWNDKSTTTDRGVARLPLPTPMTLHLGSARQSPHRA